MATKAYFLIRVEEESCQDGYQQVMEDLAAIPEVKTIESVSGRCNLLVQVEAPVRVIFVAHKIMAKEWLKHLNVLTVEPAQGRHPRPLPEVRRRLKAMLEKRTDLVRY